MKVFRRAYIRARPTLQDTDVRMVEVQMSVFLYCTHSDSSVSTTLHLQQGGGARVVVSCGVVPEMVSQ